MTTKNLFKLTARTEQEIIDTQELFEMANYLFKDAFQDNRMTVEKALSMLEESDHDVKIIAIKETEKVHSKRYCKTLAPKNYWFSGYWDNLYHFTTGDNRTGYKTTSCSYVDILDKSYLFLIEKGLTRVKS